MSAFQYVSKCCQAPAKKPALVKAKENEQDLGLGKWRCSACGKRTAVNRHKAGQ